MAEEEALQDAEAALLEEEKDEANETEKMRTRNATALAKMKEISSSYKEQLEDIKSKAQ